MRGAILQASPPPAPTNREPYVPTDAAAMDARGAELAATLGVEQESGQDLPTLIVPRENIVDVLTKLKSSGYTLPLDLWAVDYPRREQRFDVMYQLSRKGPLLNSSP